MSKGDPQKSYPLNNPGDYWRGRVVSLLKDSRSGRREYGHIIGFFRTNMGEVGINVLWENGEEFGIHPGNVDLH